jgi:hypothetical protein
MMHFDELLLCGETCHFQWCNNERKSVLCNSESTVVILGELNCRRTDSDFLRKKWDDFLSHLAPSSSNKYINLYHTRLEDLNPHTMGLMARLNSGVNGLAVC